MPKTILIAFLLSLFCVTYSYGATISKVKGTGVLIKSSPDEELTKGSLHYVVTPGGKKVGIVRIHKTTPKGSIGKLLKGKAKPNFELVERKSKKTNTAKNKDAAPPSKKSAKKAKRSKKGFIGRILSGNKRKGLGLATGFNLNNSDVTFFNKNDEKIRQDPYSGNSLSFELIFDYELLRRWYIRASVGQHNFQAGDDSNHQCKSDGEDVACNIDLTYINFDLWGHYYFTQNQFKIWAGAGVGLLLSPDASGQLRLLTLMMSPPSPCCN